MFVPRSMVCENSTPFNSIINNKALRLYNDI
nr:MAG TPA: hypothetical protein [Caudoviricetes sp.]